MIESTSDVVECALLWGFLMFSLALCFPCLYSDARAGPQVFPVRAVTASTLERRNKLDGSKADEMKRTDQDEEHAVGDSVPQ